MRWPGGDDASSIDESEVELDDDEGQYEGTWEEKKGDAEQHQGSDWSGGDMEEEAVLLDGEFDEAELGELSDDELSDSSHGTIHADGRG